MKKSIIYKLSPLNNETDMSAFQYAIKKILAFILIYGVSAVLGEGIIIGILYAMGYEPLQGIMPTGEISELLVYYGFLVFSFITILYCRIVEKKNVKFIGFSGNSLEYLIGGVIATILLSIIIGVGCVTGAISFCGVNSNINIGRLMLWAWAFGIQGAAEEIMCRGFLLNILKTRIAIPLAILISSTAFVFPHMPSLLEANIVYAVVGIINLYLISGVFSLLVLKSANIWTACGLHSVWNFVLYVIMGLSLSGSESTSKGVILFRIEGANILNGAQYGIEASIITTTVLGMLFLIMIIRWKGMGDKNGI